MNEARQRPAASFGELLEHTGCTDETELAELLTEHVDPRRVTGQIVDVVEEGDAWTLRIPGFWATVVTFPTTLGWLQEAAEDLLRECLEQTANTAVEITGDAEITDPTVLEAASWRLASALLRRHPRRLRLIRAHPAGGQADCLWLLATHDGGGDVRLNRTGSIDVVERFDRRPVTEIGSIPWSTYLGTDHRGFVQRLETVAGLPAPATTPAATPVTLTCRVLAALTSTGFKSRRHVEIEPGYIDTAGYGSGPNEEAFGAFPHLPDELLRPRPDDFYGEPGYRFWFAKRRDVPVLAFEQRQGLAWTRRDREPVSLMELYRARDRDATLTALALLDRATTGG